MNQDSNSPVGMHVNGLSCQLHTPDALSVQKVGEEEIAQPLPPYSHRPVYPVDAYPACPDNWMHGSASASSYFVPVQNGKGMWLDFNDCRSHRHYVAVVVSIQGINPLTGQPTENALRLEQYLECCPIHNVAFGQNRFCEACGYGWPKQNYLASNSTDSGYFWIDGFRAIDGIVRQFVFTEKKLRGVAAQLIGEQRVFAIGVAFYLSNAPKPVVVPPILARSKGVFIGAFSACSEETIDATLDSLDAGDETIGSFEIEDEGMELCAMAEFRVRK